MRLAAARPLCRKFEIALAAHVDAARSWRPRYLPSLLSATLGLHLRCTLTARLYATVWARPAPSVYGQYYCASSQHICEGTPCQPYRSGREEHRNTYGYRKAGTQAGQEALSDRKRSPGNHT